MIFDKLTGSSFKNKSDLVSPRTKVYSIYLHCTVLTVISEVDMSVHRYHKKNFPSYLTYCSGHHETAMKIDIFLKLTVSTVRLH